MAAVMSVTGTHVPVGIAVSTITEKAVYRRKELLGFRMQ